VNTGVSMSERLASAHKAPLRELGAFTCVAIGLTTIVGSGIYALPPTLAASLGPLSFLAFVGAALVVALIGLMTAEAAGTTAEMGGAYQYARLAFGARAGFAVAWLAWVNNILSWAGVSLALVKLLDVLEPGLGSGRNAQLIATAEIVALGVINARGARPGAAVSNVLTVGKLVPLVLFIALGFAAFDAARFAGAGERLAAAGAGGFAVAVYRCIWAAGGFENIGVIAGDVTEPQRMIPKAVLISIAASSVLYALVQAAAVSSVPNLASLSPVGAPGSVALPLAAEQAGSALASSGFGALVGKLMVIGAVVSMLGYCAGAAVVSPRYLFAMAAGGFVPRALVLLGARGTPVYAIYAATAISVACVWGFDWITLLDASVLFSLAQHATTVCAAWKLRKTVPSSGRFIAPGGAFTPVLALSSIAILCALAFTPSAGGAAVDASHFVALAIVLAAGAAVAGVSRRMARRT
jgi:basic amino acid/polyamine antiporter, APA family